MNKLSPDLKETLINNINVCRSKVESLTELNKFYFNLSIKILFFMLSGTGAVISYIFTSESSLELKQIAIFLPGTLSILIAFLLSASMPNIILAEESVSKCSASIKNDLLSLNEGAGQPYLDNILSNGDYPSWRPFKHFIFINIFIYILLPCLLVYLYLKSLCISITVFFILCLSQFLASKISKKIQFE